MAHLGNKSKSDSDRDGSLQNSTSSLNTLMILIEAYINWHVFTSPDEVPAIIPLDTVYLCAQFYGFKILMLIWLKLYTYPNMPNGLKYFRPTKDDKQDWIQFRCHVRTRRSRRADVDYTPYSWFQFEKLTKQSFVHVPHLHSSMVPDDVPVDQLHSGGTLSALIGYNTERLGVHALVFSTRGYRGYDDDTILHGFECALPSLSKEHLTDIHVQHRYSTLHQMLFASVQYNNIRKSTLYRLPMDGSPCKWQKVTDCNCKLMEADKRQQILTPSVGHYFDFIQHDKQVLLCRSVIRHTVTDPNFIQAMIYDFDADEWMEGGRMLNEQLVMVPSNMWRDIFKERLYCLGSKDGYYNDYRVCMYDLAQHQWRAYDDDVMKMYRGKGKDGEIEQLSLWTDYNNPNLLYCSMATPKKIIVEFMDDRARNKGWMSDEDMTECIGELCDPSFLYPCFT